MCGRAIVRNFYPRMPHIKGLEILWVPGTRGTRSIDSPAVASGELQSDANAVVLDKAKLSYV